MGIAVIIPTYRNPEYLDLCLRSATENNDVPGSEIMVVVDGHVGESAGVLAAYPGVSALQLPENRGMQYALNAGVMQAATEHVFIVNDDNVFPRRWASRLGEQITRCESRFPDGRWCLTVDQVEPTGPSMFDFDINDLGQTVDRFDYAGWLGWEESHSASRPELTDDGHIFPFVVAKKYYLAAGGFDTFYGSPNVCDWDFFLKLELLGFAFPRTHALHLYHFGSVATKKNAEAAQFREREARAGAEFEWKWGAAPFNASGTNSKIPPGGFRGFSA